jgi:hypothetical protein
MGDEVKVGDKFTSRLHRGVKVVEVIGFNNGYIEYSFLNDDGTHTSKTYQWATKPKSFHRQFRPKED